MATNNECNDIKFHIDKLDEISKWPKWKWQMQMLFVQQKLTRIIDGTDKCPDLPAEGADNNQKRQYSDWETRNALACNYMMGTLGNNYVDLVLSTTNASTMWKKLCSRFERTSTQRRDRLFQEFYNITPEASEDIAKYVARVTNTFTNLNAELKRANRNELDESVLITRILTSLESDARYADLWSIWEVIPENQQKIDLLTEKLCSIELRKGNSNNEETSAFTVKSNSTGKNKAGKSKTNKKRDKYIAEQKKKRPCNNCGKLGHWAAECKMKHSASDTKGHSDSTGFVANEKDISPQSNKPWICDSGASQHITLSNEFYATYEKFVPPKAISIAKGNQVMLAYGCGRIDIEVFINGKWQRSHINNVWYVPEANQNLLSVMRSAELGYKVTLDRTSVVFRKEGKLGMVGYKVGRSYILKLRMIEPNIKAVVNLATTDETLQVWHERMAHINKQQVRNVLKRMNIVLPNIENKLCDGCVFGKAHRLPFNTRTNRPTTVGEQIHADVMGPTKNASFAGKHYYVCFKDDYSKYRTLFFMKQKSEVATCLKTFLNNARATGHVIKTLRMDGGREFDNAEVREILNTNGIAAEIISPYSPQQNGVAERENRTIVELARSMLAASKLPKICWAEACATAVYVLNRAGKSSIDNKSPIELWQDKDYGSLHNLRIFGTECFVHIPKQKRQKFDNKAIKGKLVGYVNNRDGYRVYIPSKNQVICSRDVIFKPERTCTTSYVEFTESVSINNSEDTFQSQKESTGSYILPEPVEEVVAPQDRKMNLRKANECHLPKRFDDFQMNYATDYAFSAVEFVDSATPRSYKEAILSDNSAEWQAAMQEEIKSQYENETWKLVSKPHGVKLLNNRWVYRIKTDSKGKPCFKARFVVKGCNQNQGIDYDETFSPVARYDTVRTVLAITASDKLQLHQFDVKTAFLYGQLQEEVYMKQPEGFSDGSDRVCKLKKSLYGLKQAPRCWNERLVNFMQSAGMKQSKADPCLFFRERNADKLFICIYVDDGLVAGSNKNEIISFMNDLQRDFQITSGSINNFLGMKIVQNTDGSIFISQPDYTEKMLKRFNMATCNAVGMPCERDNNVAFSSEFKENVPYREAIGCLMYLSIATRPDIAYSVNKSARTMEKPSNEDWSHVKRIFKYLRGTMNYGIVYKSGNMVLNVYSDADFGGCIKTRRSTTGVVSVINEGAVSWTSQAQRSVALSTTEAEFVAATEGAKEVIWLQRLLSELGHRIQKPLLLIDSASALKLTKNPEFHKRTKHIEIRYFFVRELYLKGTLNIEHISGDANLADILTKPLDKQRFEKLRALIGVNA